MPYLWQKCEEYHSIIQSQTTCAFSCIGGFLLEEKLAHKSAKAQSSLKYAVTDTENATSAILSRSSFTQDMSGDFSGRPSKGLDSKEQSKTKVVTLLKYGNKKS